MNRKLKIESALICAAFGFLVFSCTSLQDVNIEQTGISGEFLEVHSSFASVDGAFAAGNGDESAAENLVSMIENELSDAGLLKAAAARLYALEGCVSLRLGRKSEARKFYKLSVSASNGDVYAAVLAHRLDSETKLDKDSVVGNDKAIFVLEDALDFYAKNDYISAVSCFDEAFLSLADFYRTGYGALREECWNLRSLSGNENPNSDLASLLSLKEINVSQMLMITKDDTDFLFNLTGEKKLSEKELYKKVSDSGLLDVAASSVSDGDSSSLNSSSTLSADFVVNKFAAARFFWNLYNENKSLDKKTKYSQRFSKIKMRSPVPDVPVSNPDFDAVLGCVENEFLNLEDGINFNGEKKLSALEFDESLKKIKN